MLSDDPTTLAESGKTLYSQSVIRWFGLPNAFSKFVNLGCATIFSATTQSVRLNAEPKDTRFTEGEGRTYRGSVTLDAACERTAGAEHQLAGQRRVVRLDGVVEGGSATGGTSGAVSARGCACSQSKLTQYRISAPGAPYGASWIAGSA